MPLALAGAALALTVVGPLTTTATAAPARPGSVAPVTQAFRDFLAHETTARLDSGTTTGRVAGFVPPPLQPLAPHDLTSVVFSPPSSYESELGPSPAAKSTLGDAPPGGASPATYDLRALNKLTAIRNQGKFATCWTFATMASLESALLPGETDDFSERNLANLSGFALGPNGGGNAYISTAYLTRWAGPVSEADDPYPTGSWLSSPAGLTVRKHVQDVLFLPERSGPLDNANMKWAVMSYGAVYAAMDWTDSAFRSSTASYYCTGNSANHGVDCVGWNDSYPARNFATKPPGNGAWLVRNSWGSGWGQGGYFWISYYDNVFPTESAVFCGVQTTDNYSRVYQYDPLGWVREFGFGDSTAWFADRFTAATSGSLVAVGFYTSAPDSTYEVHATSGLSGVATSPVLASGSEHVPGYHTIALSSPASLTAGATFVVAVKLTTPNCSYPVAIEAPYQGYANATASAGESYVGTDGTTWQDLTTLVANGTVCLDAYADDSSAPAPSPSPSPSPVTDVPSILSLTCNCFTDDARGTLRVNVQWQASADAGEYSYQLDHSPTAVPDTVPDTFATGTTFSGLSDGFWYFHVRAGNAAGWGNAANTEFTIDQNGPRTSALSPCTARRGHVAALRFRASDAGSATVSVVIRFFHSGRVVESLLLGIRPAANVVQSVTWRCRLPRGSYVWRVYGTDQAGNAQSVLGQRALRVY